MSKTEESSPSKQIPPKQSWRLRWSLRVLIAGITLACFLFAWISHWGRVGQTHEEIGTYLETLQTESEKRQALWRGNIEVRWALEIRNDTPRNTNHTSLSRSRPRQIPPASKRPLYDKQSPSWMQSTGTESLFQRIKTIKLSHFTAGKQLDTVVEQVSRLDRVEFLKLQNIEISNQQLSLIVSNVSISRLQGRWLTLSDGPIPGLNRFEIRHLDLSHTRFSDSAIDDLPDSLEQLDLERTAVTDIGLGDLVRLTKLRGLNLKRTPTSEAAIEELRRKMPWCEIEWEPLVIEEN